MKGRTYRYFEGKPLYPFGHGLSYTEFRFGKPKFITEDGSMAVAVDVKNIGRCSGETVVQLYVSKIDDEDGPIRTLRGYERISLDAGEKGRIVIPVNDETLLWWDEEVGRMATVPGKYILQIGDSSDENRLKTIKYCF